jgi:hypothetical protein
MSATLIVDGWPSETEWHSTGGALGVYPAAEGTVRIDGPLPMTSDAIQGITVDDPWGTKQHAFRPLRAGDRVRLLSCGRSCNGGCKPFATATVANIVTSSMYRRGGTVTCRCGRIKVGSTVTENRDWNPDCAEHGVKSEWYQSPERTAKRQAESDRLRDLYRRAREARATITDVEEPS